MKRGLKLRRFKSEVSVREEKSGVTSGKPGTTTTLSIEPSGGGESDATELLQMEGLSHAVSQPNILNIKQPSPRLKHKRPTGTAYFSVYNLLVGSPFQIKSPAYIRLLCVIIFSHSNHTSLQFSLQYIIWSLNR
jgi:hypothetical protein